MSREIEDKPEWEKIFAKNTFNKGLLSKVHKELLKISKKTSSLILKMGLRSSYTTHQRRYR